MPQRVHRLSVLAPHSDLGYTRKEFAKMTWSDFQSDLTTEETQQKLQRAWEDSNTTFTTNHRTKAGAICEVLVQTEGLSYDDQSVVLLNIQNTATE
jgi:hypothetical protein